MKVKGCNGSCGEAVVKRCHSTGVKGVCTGLGSTQEDISTVLALLHAIQYQRFGGMSLELFHVLCV